MNSKLIWTMATVGMLCTGSAMAQKPSGMFTDDDPLPFIRAGMFMLQDGQREGIANDTKAEPYQICAGKAGKELQQGAAGIAQPERSVPLEVMYDGKNATVAPGTCADFTARDITVMPAAALNQDEVLMGRYKHLKG